MMTALPTYERRFSRCREPSCRKQIVWLTNPATGKAVPVDADTVMPQHEHFDSKLGHVSHFKTCTAPSRFSKVPRGVAQ